MEIKTKFNIGDKFWALNKNRASQETVTEILIKVTPDKTEIIYHTQNIYERLVAFANDSANKWGMTFDPAISTNNLQISSKYSCNESECFASQEDLGKYVKTMKK